MSLERTNSRRGRQEEVLCAGPLEVQRQEPGKLKGPVLSDKKPRAVNGLLCPTSADGGAPSGDKNPARNSPARTASGQRANGCQDVDEQARAGEVSGEGPGKDQEKLEICQNPTGVRYSRG